jgi:hypothetical protein
MALGFLGGMMIGSMMANSNGGKPVETVVITPLAPSHKLISCESTRGLCWYEGDRISDAQFAGNEGYRFIYARYYLFKDGNTPTLVMDVSQ